MKNIKRILLLLLGPVFLTACGNIGVIHTSDATIAEEVAVTEPMEIVEGTVNLTEEAAMGPETDVLGLIEDMVKYEKQKQEETTEEAAVELVIYYSNGRADGLEMETVITSAITAEAIIGNLSKKNIVSIDTHINTFDCRDEAGARVVYIDLSKAFGEYIKTMGIRGEEVIIAALTNTFLHNYDADGLVLTVEGGILKTGHRTYDEPITFIPMGEEQKDV